MRYFMLACLFSIVLTERSDAQANPDSVKHLNECRLAEQVMNTGHPERHREWARGYIGSCGTETWGRAAAAAVRRSRMSQDRRTLEAEWASAHLLRDSVLFAAAMEIAGDANSSIGARIFAVRYLIRLIDPNPVVTYDLMARGLDAKGRRTSPCYERTVAGRLAEYPGVPLPADLRGRIAALLRRVYVDPAQPAEVRSAALCLGRPPRAEFLVPS
jgi:hypothetical protein